MSTERGLQLRSGSRQTVVYYFSCFEVELKKNINDDFKQLSCIIIKRLAVPERGQVPPARGATTKFLGISIRTIISIKYQAKYRHFYRIVRR